MKEPPKSSPKAVKSQKKSEQKIKKKKSTIKSTSGSNCPSKFGPPRVTRSPQVSPSRPIFIKRGNGLQPLSTPPRTPSPKSPRKVPPRASLPTNSPRSIVSKRKKICNPRRSSSPKPLNSPRLVSVSPQKTNSGQTASPRKISTSRSKGSPRS